ncbi:MAG TPA: hypothetical protein VJU78_09855 [Chitinophagaceae bacterium]|nr:hypothetical protein [Chitinophagaceae bacterium]
MWIVYLELLGIPLAIFAWILYRTLVKKEVWRKVEPDLQLAAFVGAVWYLVYFVLLR